MVCLTPVDAHDRRPGDAGPVGDHAGSRDPSATALKAATRAGISGGTGAVAANGSCPGRKLEDWARCLVQGMTAKSLTAAVRLLLLTGCRRNEIMTLQWQDYRDGHLFLRDSKTGPRTVWLSSATRAVLDGLPRTGRLGLSGQGTKAAQSTGSEPVLAKAP